MCALITISVTQMQTLSRLYANKNLARLHWPKCLHKVWFVFDERLNRKERKRGKACLENYF